MLLEVVTDSVVSSVTAANAGADRIELCAGLLEGGITPSYGLIESVRRAVDIDVFVMIRPRGGDFLYSGSEIETMKKDIIVAKKLGVDGVVLGVLNKDGTINKLQMEELLDLVRPLQTTFHRAFDYTVSPDASLEGLCSLGVDRVLTSGQRTGALEGKETIRKLKEQAGDRIIIMPGGGVSEDNIEELVSSTGCSEYHMSGKSLVQSLMEYRKPGMTVGRDADRDEFERYETDESKVRAVRAALDNLSSVHKKT